MGQGSEDRRARPHHPLLRGAALRRRRRRRDAHGHSAALPAEDARRAGRPVEERPPLSRAALWHPERRGRGPRRLLLLQRKENLIYAVLTASPGLMTPSLRTRARRPARCTRVAMAPA